MCIWRGIILLATWWLRANQFPSNKLSTFVSFVFPLAPSGGSWDVALSRHCLLCLLCWSLDAPSSIMLRNGMFTIKALNNTSGFSPFARGVKAYCTCIPSFKSHASGRRHESDRLTFEAHKPVQTVLFPAINHRIRLHPFYPLIRFEKRIWNPQHVLHGRCYGCSLLPFLFSLNANSRLIASFFSGSICKCLFPRNSK